MIFKLNVRMFVPILYKKRPERSFSRSLDKKLLRNGQDRSLLLPIILMTLFLINMIEKSEKIYYYRNTRILRE